MFGCWDNTEREKEGFFLLFKHCLVWRERMRKKDTFCGFYSDFLFCLTSLWLNWYLCSFLFGFSLVWLSRDKEFLFCLCIVCLSRKQGSEEMKRFSFFIWIIFLPSFARLCLAVEKTETIKKKSSIFVCFGWYLCVFFSLLV